MIKLFEEYSKKQLTLTQKLFSEISADNKVINGYNCSYEMSGSFGWRNKESKYMIYATPYWESDDYLPIEIYNEDTSDLDFTVKYKLKKPETIEDIKIIKKFYYDTIETIIKNLSEIISSKKYNI